MSMVNDPKTSQPKLGTEVLKFVGNLIVISGQVAFLFLQVVVVILGAVGAILVGVTRGAKHRR